MIIQVVAHPNAKAESISEDAFHTLHVYVNEPAQKGKANQAITLALAKFYQVPKTNIRILKGAKSKTKVFEVV